MSLTPEFTIRNMTVKLSTSTASSDITNQIHGFTDLAHSKEDELMVITEGDSIYVTDERGTRTGGCGGRCGAPGPYVWAGWRDSRVARRKRKYRSA